MAKKKLTQLDIFKRLAVIALAAVLSVTAVFGGLAITNAAIGPKFRDSYYAALPVKYDRLYSIEGSKLVVIGGSSVAFGIDTELAERELGMPCVDFGLYAAFGLKPMLDLAAGAISKGDIVVITPELSGYMYSDAVGYEYLAQALDGRGDMKLRLGAGYFTGLLASIPGCISTKLKLASAESKESGTVYSASSFDEQGRMIYKRENNIMDGGYTMDNLPELDPAMVTDSFVAMIGSFAGAMERKGARVYFGFPPVNRLAVEMAAEDGKTGPELLEAELRRKLGVRILSGISDHIMEPGYFYDSNYHMNDTGKVYNTLLLINDIKRETGDLGNTSIQLPKPPAGSSENAVLSSGEQDGLKYDVTSSGVIITGLNNEGRRKRVLTVPESIENAKVYKIGNRAFAGASAETIELPEVSVLGGEIFKDAASLKDVHLRAVKLPEVGDSLLSGAPANVKIYVPQEVYGTYITDYFWARFNTKLAGE